LFALHIVYNRHLYILTIQYRRYLRHSRKCRFSLDFSVGNSCRIINYIILHNVIYAFGVCVCVCSNCINYNCISIIYCDQISEYLRYTHRALSVYSPINWLVIITRATLYTYINGSRRRKTQSLYYQIVYYNRILWV